MSAAAQFVIPSEGELPMQSNRTRVAIGVALVAAAVALFIVLSGSDDDSGEGTSASANQRGAEVAQAPPMPTIRLRQGEPIGGVQELSVNSGDQVRFRVVSDLAGQVHVHGYDYEKPVRTGGSVGFDFRATLEGGFEIELHHAAGESEIAELRVEP
jgi:hypothetical protein